MSELKLRPTKREAGASRSQKPRNRKTAFNHRCVRVISVVAQTKIKIHARFATPEDTARALGVPMRRVRKLIKLIDSYRSLKKAGLSDKKALRRLNKTSAFKNAPPIREMVPGSNRIRPAEAKNSATTI